MKESNQAVGGNKKSRGNPRIRRSIGLQCASSPQRRWSRHLSRRGMNSINPYRDPIDGGELKQRSTETVGW
jgi:hypothetical protein